MQSHRCKCVWVASATSRQRDCIPRGCHVWLVYVTLQYGNAVMLIFVRRPAGRVCRLISLVPPCFLAAPVRSRKAKARNMPDALESDRPALRNQRGGATNLHMCTRRPQVQTCTYLRHACNLPFHVVAPLSRMAPLTCVCSGRACHDRRFSQQRVLRATPRPPKKRVRAEPTLIYAIDPSTCKS